MLADGGYASERNLEMLEKRRIDGYIAVGREKNFGEGKLPGPGTKPARMSRKVRSKRGRKRYRARKHIAEPAFGWVESAMGFRQFSLRGLDSVACRRPRGCAASRRRGTEAGDLGQRSWHRAASPWRVRSTRIPCA